MTRTLLIAGASGISLILGWLLGRELQSSEGRAITSESFSWGLMTDATVLQFRNATPETAITMVRAYVRRVEECASSAASRYPCDGATLVQGHIMLAELCHDMKDVACESASFQAATDECVKAQLGECAEANLRQRLRGWRSHGTTPGRSGGE
jgi:hypothetical protein